MEGLFLGHITSLLSEDPQPQQSPQEDGLAPKAQDQLHHSSIGRWPRPVMCQDILKSDYTSRKPNKAFPRGLAEDTDTERENGSFEPYEMPIFMSKMMALDHFIWCSLSDAICCPVIETCVVVVCCLRLTKERAVQLRERGLEKGQRWLGAFAGEPWSQKRKEWTVHVRRTFWNRLPLGSYLDEPIICLIRGIVPQEHIRIEGLWPSELT